MRIYERYWYLYYIYITEIFWDTKDVQLAAMLSPPEAHWISRFARSISTGKRQMKWRYPFTVSLFSAEESNLIALQTRMVVKSSCFVQLYSSWYFKHLGRAEAPVVTGVGNHWGRHWCLQHLWEIAISWSCYWNTMLPWTPLPPRMTGTLCVRRYRRITRMLFGCCWMLLVLLEGAANDLYMKEESHHASKLLPVENILWDLVSHQVLATNTNITNRPMYGLFLHPFLGLSGSSPPMFVRSSPRLGRTFPSLRRDIQPWQKFMLPGFVERDRGTGFACVWDWWDWCVSGRNQENIATCTVLYTLLYICIPHCIVRPNQSVVFEWFWWVCITVLLASVGLPRWELQLSSRKASSTVCSGERPVGKSRTGWRWIRLPERLMGWTVAPPTSILKQEFHSGPAISEKSSTRFNLTTGAHEIEPT